MCIAVDKSGSTIGATIKTELNVVRQLCHLRHDPNQRPVTLLPWCAEAYDPIVLHEGGVRGLSGVLAGGDTDLRCSTSLELALKPSVHRGYGF
jgi:hypothetical protein